MGRRHGRFGEGFAVKDINNSVKSDPRNLMDIGRTIMANERTLLAFLRTSLGFLLGGIAMIKYLKHPLIEGLGWVSIFLAPVFLIWGLYRYRHVKKILKAVTPKELVTVEKEIGL